VRVPVLSRDVVVAAVPPLRAYDAVLEGFVRHARGEWMMQPKVYVTNYPAGDFRAMPAKPVAIERFMTTIWCAWSTLRIGMP